MQKTCTNTGYTPGSVSTKLQYTGSKMECIQMQIHVTNDHMPKHLSARSTDEHLHVVTSDLTIIPIIRPSELHIYLNIITILKAYRIIIKNLNTPVHYIKIHKLFYLTKIIQFWCSFRKHQKSVTNTQVVTITSTCAGRWYFV